MQVKKLSLFSVFALACLVAGCGADENKTSISSIEATSVSNKTAQTEKNHKISL